MIIRTFNENNDILNNKTITIVELTKLCNKAQELSLLSLDKDAFYNPESYYIGYYECEGEKVVVDHYNNLIAFV